MEEQTQLKMTQLSQVETQTVRWLWYPFIPYGKLTIIQGDPGDGKSTFILNIAAMLSKGQGFDADMEQGNPVNVIYQTAEDGLADTVKPRLESAGADCTRISIIDESEKSVSMTDDRLEQAIRKENAGLLILDPIQAYLGCGTDMNRANEAREMTKKLGSIAERTGCAIVLIGHMNKGSGAKAAYRGMGSIDFYAVARSVLLVGRIEGQPNMRAVVQIKNNLSAFGHSKAFELTEEGFRWIGDYEITADEILGGIAPKACKLDMKRIFKLLLDELRDRMPDFKVANAVILFDEESPHMHVVGVPVATGFKKSLRKQVSKRSVFTPYTLSKILQGDLREFIDEKVSVVFGEQIKEKSKGRNHDLTVAEYKVAKETEKLKLLGEDIDRKEKSLADIKGSIELQSAILDYTKDELEEKQHQADRAVKVLEQVKRFVGMFHLLAPTIEEYATAVERDGRLDAGNSFRGILYELGKLLERFKELIREGLCWFPRLMRWKTSVGEVAPVFRDTDNGYSYSVCGYMNVETKVQYSKETLQCEISAEMRVGTMETLDANIEAMERDLAEILRLSGEKERLWKAYEDWKGR